MKYKASVVIPTYNGEAYIKDVLKAVFTQKYEGGYEVLVIDSGSTDATLDIVTVFDKKHANMRLHQIPNSEFGHGKTRQMAAGMAKGEFVVYLSHDAIPAHEYWLYEMTRPFDIDDRIVAIMGKQAPRHNCPPTIKYDIVSVFNSFGPDFGTTIFYKDSFIKDQAVYDAVRFYSDVNSAARKKTLLGKIPYKDVQYAEDQLFGEDVIESGNYKAYAPRGAVIHSNDVSLGNYHKRIFDEVYGMRKAGVLNSSPRMLPLVFVKSTIKDTMLILLDKQYSKKRKLYWLVVNPLFHAQKMRGTWKGMRVGLNDVKSAEANSLESSTK